MLEFSLASRLRSDNLAATKWLGLTVDPQFVNPGLEKTLKSSGELKDVNTAVVAGLRASVRR
ncbi:MAG: hypothetical protein DME03_01700 [Candidatus Rokuibacteriota bacterium]|nr:MAG: hypothetical protein DME03_01700 [Candidatus Rokubacteria bacterium]